MANEQAKQIAQNIVKGGGAGSVSSSSAGTVAPVADMGDAGLNLSGRGQRAFSSAEAQGLNGKLEGVDSTAVNQFRSATAAAQASKRVQGLNFAQKLGDVRNQIAQNNFEAQQKQAAQGFIGSGAQDRAQVQANQLAQNTLQGQERQYESNLRGLNAQIATNRQAELQALKPGMSKVFAQQTLGEQGTYKMESDEGFFGRIGGAFGKDQKSSGRLEAEAFKNNANMQELGKELGIDITAPDFVNKVNEQMKTVLTAKADSVYDRTTDIMVDMGNGPQKVSEQTKTLGKAIFDGFMGAINVVTLVAIPFTLGASSLLSAGVTATIDATAAAAAEGVAVTVGELSASEMAITGSEFIGSSLSAGISEGIASSPELLTSIGGEEALAGVSEGLSTSLAESIEASIGAEAADAVSAQTLNAATKAASQVFTESIAAGMTADEAIQSATLAATELISENTALTTIGTAAGEAMATETAGAAGSGAAGSEATGVVGSEATGATGSEAVGVGQEATQGTAQELQALKPQQPGVAPAKLTGAKGFARVGQVLKNRAATKAATQGATQTGFKAGVNATFKAPFKIAMRGAKAMVTTDTGLVATLSETAAVGIKELYENLAKQGVDEKVIKTEVDKLIEKLGTKQ